jgi:hypothetical protein
VLVPEREPEQARERADGSRSGASDLTQNPNQNRLRTCGLGV